MQRAKARAQATRSVAAEVADALAAGRARKRASRIANGEALSVVAPKPDELRHDVQLGVDAVRPVSGNLEELGRKRVYDRLAPRARDLRDVLHLLIVPGPSRRLEHRPSSSNGVVRPPRSLSQTHLTNEDARRQRRGGHSRGTHPAAEGAATATAPSFRRATSSERAPGRAPLRTGSLP